MELDGPGKLFGYRAMQNELRQVHGLLILGDLVHAVMFDVDAKGLTARCPIRKSAKAKRSFTTKGVNRCVDLTDATDLWVTRIPQFHSQCMGV